MGNILFLIGITLLLGPSRTFVFFARRQKWRGSLCFWAGVGLILIRWTFVGFAIECVGIFYLFGEYVCPMLFLPFLGFLVEGRCLVVRQALWTGRSRSLTESVC